MKSPKFLGVGHGENPKNFSSIASGIGFMPNFCRKNSHGKQPLEDPVAVEVLVPRDWSTVLYRLLPRPLSSLSKNHRGCLSKEPQFFFPSFFYSPYPERNFQGLNGAKRNSPGTDDPSRRYTYVPLSQKKICKARFLTN